MLGLAHTLVAAGLHDRAFLARYCVGWETFEAYLFGRTDGQPKDAAWAAAICGIAGRRDRGPGAALCRAAHPRHLLDVVAARRARRATGVDGPGAGRHARPDRLEGRRLRLCAGGDLQHRQAALGGAAADDADRAQPDRRFHPGGAHRRPAAAARATPSTTTGSASTYPDIRLVYWAGGNPFHHHQDLNRLRRAFCRPDTVIVQDSAWTASARHADIVLPATITLEREDIGASAGDPLHGGDAPRRRPLSARRATTMRFSPGWRERLGFGDAFTEGRTARQWLEHLYEATRRALAERGVNAPDFAQFWEDGELVLPTQPWDGGPLRAFRRDPEGAKLPTPSGRIEIASATIAGFGYPDCPGHPAWLPPADGAGSPAAARFPLQLVANQPATRLHSQLDFGATSHGREDQRARAGAHQSGGRCRPRHQGRRHRAALQRARRLPRRRGAERGVAPRRRAAGDRRLVRPGRSGRRGAALRPRQPERADPRRRHVAAGAGLHRPADAA